MEKFHEFYRELIAVHDQFDRGDLPAATVHDRLVTLLNRQEGEAQRESGSYGAELYGRAKYAMAALGDEILLRHDSAHSERWMAQLLEATLFRSQRAGEKVFDDIYEMQNLGAAAGDLGRVYLAVLGLGFQGAYRGMDNPDQYIEPYREKLFRLAYGEPAMMSGRRQIAAPAYASTITDGESGTLPHLRPWIYALLLIVLFYVAAGAAIWQYEVVDLDPIVQAIQATKTTPLPGATP